jgi:hypothetical protein
VAARLGNVELDGTWHATYVLVHRQQGDFVTLKVFDPVGAQRLERELPAQGAACSTLPAVIALVLERFFAPPEQTQPAAPTAAPTAPAADPPAERAPSTATERPAQSEATPAIASASVALPAPPADSASPKAPDDARPSFELAAELWASSAWLAPGLRVARRLGGPYWIGLEAAFDLASHHVSAFEGSVSARRVPISLVARRELTGGAVALSGGLELLGLFEVASASDLAQSDGGARLVPGAGLRFGAHFLPGSSLAPFLELTGAWLARRAAPAFQVGDREVLTPPTWVVGGAFGIDANF